MRLTCPNCDAQYEVEASLIPAAGRDVQCSNCGTTWFQPPEGKDEELARDLGRPVAEPPAPEEPEDEDEDEAPAAAPPPRRPADEKVKGILREEAEREMAARQRERTPSLETQPDLGLSATVTETAGTRGEKAKGEDADSASRRDLLPDIDEINSTLNATSARPGEEPTADVIQETRRHRSGFRMGFSLVIIVVAVLIALYLFATEISATVPALEGPMAAYVDWGNGVRLWFDGLLESSVETLSKLIVSMTGKN